MPCGIPPINHGYARKRHGPCKIQLRVSQIAAALLFELGTVDIR
jgi:hypothetical protein